MSPIIYQELFRNVLSLPLVLYRCHHSMEVKLESPINLVSRLITLFLAMVPFLLHFLYSMEIWSLMELLALSKALLAPIAIAES